MPDMTEAEAILEAARMQAAATITAALVARDPNRDLTRAGLRELAFETFDVLMVQMMENT